LTRDTLDQVECLRECGGHGGKARERAAARLHVGPSNLPHHVVTAQTDDELRFKQTRAVLSFCTAICWHPL
jgi:hypothetical protein